MTLIRPNFSYIYGSGFKQLRAATLAYLVFNALACEAIPGTNGSRCSAAQLCEPGLMCNENNLCVPIRDTADGNDTGADVLDLGEDAGLPMTADADVDSSVISDTGADVLDLGEDAGLPMDADVDSSVISDTGADVLDLEDAGLPMDADVDSSMDVGADIDSGDVDNTDTGGTPQPADECSKVFGLSCTAFNEAFIKASNTNAGDVFGRTIALSGDTLAVGAISEDSAGIGVNNDSRTITQRRVAGQFTYLFVRIKLGGTKLTSKLQTPKGAIYLEPQ